MITLRRGLGQTTTSYNPNSPNLVVNPDTGQIVQCDFANLQNLFNAACWGYGTLYGPSATLNVPAPATPPAPTTAQLTATQQQIDQCPDGTEGDQCVANAASQLAQTLTNEAVTQTQQNLSSANPPTGTAPFCGTGSSQWIAGVDNCTLLEIGGAIVGLFLLIGLTKSGRRR